MAPLQLQVAPRQQQVAPRHLQVAPRQPKVAPPQSQRPPWPQRTPVRCCCCRFGLRGSRRCWCRVSCRCRRDDCSEYQVERSTPPHSQVLPLHPVQVSPCCCCHHLRLSGRCRSRFLMMYSRHRVMSGPSGIGTRWHRSSRSQVRRHWSVKARLDDQQESVIGGLPWAWRSSFQCLVQCSSTLESSRRVAKLSMRSFPAT